jgi:hypothetical protein
MPRMLFSLKFWALTIAVVWILVVTAIITINPEFAHVPQ